MRVASLALLGLALVSCSGPRLSVLPPPMPSMVPPAPVVEREEAEAIQTRSLIELSRLRQSGVVVWEPQPSGSYHLSVQTDMTATVQFQSGEIIGSVFGGGGKITLRGGEEKPKTLWTIEQQASGTGAGYRQHLEITAHVDKGQTVIVVSTSYGLYRLYVTVTAHTPTPAVAFWSLPSTPEPLARVPVEQYGLGYQRLVEKDRLPWWVPEEIWDTQRITIFRFPLALLQADAPVVYGVDAAGETFLVNATPEGRHLKVDRVLPAWELRLKDHVVRVRQAPDYHVASCPGSLGCPPQ